MKGLYYREKAGLTTDRAEAKRLMREAGKAYMSASENFSEDDELYAWNMSIALDNMVRGSGPPHDSMDCMTKVKAALPKIQKIWGKSALVLRGRDALIQTQFKHEAAIRRQLA
ncbi:hypothetical protein PM082_023487 [Marasmius tenuissimus]|nr:hypothetical protein PM082_023487 [Marasmius tenuissimus]